MSLGTFGEKMAILETSTPSTVVINGRVDLPAGQYRCVLYYYKNSVWTYMTNYSTHSTIFTVVEPTLTVVSSTASIAQSANSTVNVAITSNTSWNATSDQSWLTVSPTSITGNATLILTATANTGAIRTANVTLSATGVIFQTIVVTQRSVALALDIVLSPSVCSIFPNPVQNILHVKSNSAIKILKVLDISGRLLLSNENANELSVNMLQKGSYLLQVESTDWIRILHFIKE